MYESEQEKLRDVRINTDENKNLIIGAGNIKKKILTKRELLKYLKKPWKIRLKKMFKKPLNKER